MITKYLVTSEYASAIFYDKDAAVSAYMLLTDYHDLDIQRREVEHMLQLYGKHTAPPLEVEAFGDPDEGEGRGLVE